jgi:type I pantothenate kinase
MMGARLPTPGFDPETLRAIAAAAGRFKPATGGFVIGVTGSVASGKSALAHALASAVGGQSAEVISTDGFLLPNHVLAARGLEARKGYPETYDVAALSAALTGLRLGAVSIPAYSHVTYDVDPAAARIIDRPAVLVVEGLALGLGRPVQPGRAGLIDCLIYLDAAEADLEAWFVARFMTLWEAAEDDPASFYARFRGLDRGGAEDLARAVWRGINLPNLRDHIAPVRDLADLIVTKGPGHAVTGLVSSRP